VVDSFVIGPGRRASADSGRGHRPRYGSPNNLRTARGETMTTADLLRRTGRGCLWQVAGIRALSIPMADAILLDHIVEIDAADGEKAAWNFLIL